MIKNVFIVTSTINTSLTAVPISVRFQQTLETIESIRKKDSSAVIIFIDNSIFLDQQIQDIIKSNVDYYYYIGDRSISKIFNQLGIKGAGDLYTTLTGFDAIKFNSIQPKRIFKICGRYKLSENFKINYYDNEIFYSKLCFKKHELSLITNKMFFHTRFWSSCGTIINDTVEILKKSFQTHLYESITIEESIYKNMNFQKLIELDKIHCEGYLAQTNELIYD